MQSLFKSKLNSLTTTYFRNFLYLIIIPILIIIFVVFNIVQINVRNTTLGKIELAQENISLSLNREVMDTMIRLSHLVHTNNNQIIEMAAETNEKDEKIRYNSTQKLTEAFRYMVVPADDIISICFYMKDGTYTYLKDYIKVSRQEVETSKWYTEAINHKGQVQLGAFADQATYSNAKKNAFTLVTAMTPTQIMDKRGVIETVVMLVSSDVGYMISSYNQQKSLGTMYLIDKDRNIIFNKNGQEIVIPELNLFNEEGIYEGKINGQRMLYKLSDVPKTEWKLVSVVEYNHLTADFYKIAYWILAVTLGLFVLFTIYSYFFLKDIITPVNNMAAGFRLVESGNLDVHLEPNGQAEIRNMTSGFNTMIKRLKALIEANRQEEKKKHQAEIKALQSQINPHFLVNSLNSIRFMAQVSKFDGIKNMAEALINILSCSFRNNISFYSVNEEIDILKSYVFLMEIRYSNGFEVTYEVDEACTLYQIPRLILQPLLENAIVHGFSDMEEIGQIKVKVYKDYQYLYFVIEDNGKGMTEQEIDKVLKADESEQVSNSIGISNVNNRLKLNYGEHYGLHIDSKLGCYTRITLYIPKMIN